jgi:hypothetical protein
LFRSKLTFIKQRKRENSRKETEAATVIRDHASFLLIGSKHVVIMKRGTKTKNLRERSSMMVAWRVDLNKSNRKIK